MNAVGRQRSGTSTAHHQRQYSDNFLENSSNGRWLQSAGLQHLQTSNNSIPPPQDYGYYGGAQGSRMYRGAQRTYSGGSDLFAEPLTPPGNPRQSSQRRNGDEEISPNEFSPELLDLHSLDTELLPEDFRITPMKLSEVKDTLIMRKFGSVEPDNYWYRVCEGETESVVQQKTPLSGPSKNNIQNQKRRKRNSVTKEATDLMQKLSLDSQNKTLEIAEPKKKTWEMVRSRSVTPLLPDFMDPTLCYVPNGYPSYYDGYDGSGNEWEDYSRYVNPEGVEMTGVYGDNGSFMYQHGYGYAPYSPYSPATSPVLTVGHDGQLYGAQHYHYPYFQPLPPTSAPYTTPVTLAKGEIATSAAADQAPLSVNSANGNSNGIVNGGVKGNTAPTLVRPAFQNSSLNANGSFGLGGALPGGVASGYQDPRFGFDGVRSPIPWLDGSIFTDGQARPVASNPIMPSFSNGGAVPSSKNQNVHPHLMGIDLLGCEIMSLPDKLQQGLTL